MSATLDEIFHILAEIRAELPALVQRSQITGSQIVVGEGLSDISRKLGLIQAGEFRSGNGLEPGHGFSGVRIGYPAFVYSSDLWHIAGVNNDVLQVGINATDGSLYAGGGMVQLSSDGIVVYANGSWDPFIQFYDGVNHRGSLYLNSSGLMELQGDLGVSMAATDGAVSNWITLTDASWKRSLLREDPDNTNVVQFSVDLGTDGTQWSIGGGENVIWAGKTGKVTVFNDGGYDIDFRIETDSNPSTLLIDGGLNHATSFVWDGWMDMYHNTWTRTGNYTFTVAGNVTTFYKPGARIRCWNNSTWVYGVILNASYSSPNTTITLFTNTDYTLASGTISSQSLSYLPLPDGFPTYFNYTPALTGITLGNGTVTGKFHVIGSTVFGEFKFTLGSTSSMSATVNKIDYPSSPNEDAYSVICVLALVDTGTALFSGISLGGASLRCVNAAGTYAIFAYVTNTAPHTWVTSDFIVGHFEYRFY